MQTNSKLLFTKYMYDFHGTLSGWTIDFGFYFFSELEKRFSENYRHDTDFKIFRAGTDFKILLHGILFRNFVARNLPVSCRHGQALL